jgi:hypothetical protein
MTETSTTYAFRYDRWCGWLLGLLGHGRRLSRITVDAGPVDAGTVEVRMGLAFRASLPRGTVVEAAPYDGRVWGWGVHGWRGRWLVNGSSHGLVTLTLEPPAPARVLGIPVHLRQLIVSLEDPEGFLAEVGTSHDTR